MVQCYQTWIRTVTIATVADLVTARSIPKIGIGLLMQVHQLPSFQPRPKTGEILITNTTVEDLSLLLNLLLNPCKSVLAIKTYVFLTG